MANPKDSKEQRRRLAEAIRKRKWRIDHAEYTFAYRRANSERYAFYEHRSHAKSRGIEFIMTFEEWLTIWRCSGKWGQRGCKRGQYVMARHGDKGPYATWNVSIISAGENQTEQAVNLSVESRKRKGDAHRGKHLSEHHRQKMSAALRGRSLSEETRRKISAARKAH